MTLPVLPPCYCTNVHPGLTADGVVAALDEFAVPVRDRVAGERNAAGEAGADAMAVGLWFARPVATELRADPDRTARLADDLAARGLSCYTLNAFPHGDFHAAAVKAAVYRPDWSTADRLDYTRDCCELLAALLPEGREGSVSTLPLGSDLNGPLPDGFESDCVARLLDSAAFLDELHDRTGRVVRLAIEPEPFCRIETTPGAVAFFDRLREAADARGLAGPAGEHLGLCFDVCHQAVEFESIADSFAALAAADVRVNKVQLSCAPELRDPAANAEGRAVLRRFVEPRYLHQTFAADGAGAVVTKSADLTADLCDAPPPGFAGAAAWRVHFHVPVSETSLGPLHTTRPQLGEALAAVAALPYAPHLEVETYTWPVLPDAAGGDDTTGPARLIDGIARELTAVRDLCDAVGRP